MENRCLLSGQLQCFKPLQIILALSWQHNGAEKNDFANFISKKKNAQNTLSPLNNYTVQMVCLPLTSGSGHTVDALIDWLTDIRQAIIRDVLIIFQLHHSSSFGRNLDQYHSSAPDICTKLLPALRRIPPLMKFLRRRAGRVTY